MKYTYLISLKHRKRKTASHAVQDIAKAKKKKRGKKA